MSVINQVLKQLEQRGTETALDSVRAVQGIKRRFSMPLLPLGLALALALAGGIAAWQWIQMHKPVAASAVQAVIPVSSVPAAAAGVASMAAASSAMPQVVMTPVSSLPVAGVALPAKARPQDSRAASKSQFSAKGHDVAKPASGQAADKPDASIIKQVSTAQHADAEFRKAVTLMQQGHITDAIAGYEEALRLDASHDAARKALVALLLESKRGGDAERVLQDVLENKPEHTGFAMLLARLQVEHGAVETATATLNKSLPYAEKQASYQAFLAALLQRQDKHNEAIIYYQNALRISPNNGIWLMGCGISLQAVKRFDDARTAFKLALESRDLNPELRAFVQQKLKEL